MGEPTKGGIIDIGRIDRRCDDGMFFRPLGCQKNAQPIPQKRTVDRRVGQRQRIKAARLSGGDPAIPPANAAHEDFCPAILIEQDGARIEFLGLGRKKIHDHGLAGSRWADDREIAEITMVEVEEEGGRAGCLQQRDGLSPMIARGLPDGKAMQRPKTGHIGAGNERTPDKKGFIAGELPPETGL